MSLLAEDKGRTATDLDLDLRNKYDHGDSKQLVHIAQKITI